MKPSPEDRLRALRMIAESERRLQEQIRVQIARMEAPDYDPTCVFCVNGEEPGHEH